MSCNFYLTISIAVNLVLFFLYIFHIIKPKWFDITELKLHFAFVSVKLEQNKDKEKEELIKENARLKEQLEVIRTKRNVFVLLSWFIAALIVYMVYKIKLKNKAVTVKIDLPQIESSKNDETG